MKHGISHTVTPKGDQKMITALETSYAGCRFRSRLEARWAVFFDHMGIRWEYEPKGFMTTYGPYLPDFRLPEAKLFVEIKGIDPNEREFAVGLEITKAVRKQGGHYLILAGDIPRDLDDETAWIYVRESWDKPAPRLERWHRTYLAMAWVIAKREHIVSGDDPMIYWEALEAARSARFEYGETPRYDRRR